MKGREVASRKTGLYDSNLGIAFLWPLKWLLVTLLLYILLGLVALTAAFLFAKYQWLDPVKSADALFQAETVRVNQLVHSGIQVAGLATLTELTQQCTYWLFFKATTLHDAAYAYFSGYQVNEVDRLYLSQFIASNAREIYLAMNVIQVYGIRIGFVLTTVPLFFLLYIVAGVDGLTERYIRRACSGRESADMHKIGRLSKLMFFASGITLYLCLPISMSPFWIIAPLAVVFSVATRVQWQFYKKYF